MFGLFGSRQAEQVAVAINHLVLALSHAETTGGMDACVEYLTKIGHLRYDTTDRNGRTVGASIFILTHEFLVNISDRMADKTRDKPFVMISGFKEFGGFVFSCALPPGTFLVEVEPSLVYGVTRKAYLLVSAIQKMTRDFERHW
jgi:hypothetical protein